MRVGKDSLTREDFIKMVKLAEEVVYLCNRYEIEACTVVIRGELTVDVIFNLDALDHGKLALLFSSFDYRYKMTRMSLTNRMLRYELSVLEEDEDRYFGGVFDPSEMRDRDYVTETSDVYDRMFDEFYEDTFDELYDGLYDKWLRDDT